MTFFSSLEKSCAWGRVTGAAVAIKLPPQEFACCYGGPGFLKSATNLNKYKPVRAAATIRASSYRNAAPQYAKKTSQRLLQLLQYGRIFERGHVLRDFLAFSDRAKQAPHDLARARLGQVFAKADFLGLGDRSDLLADPIAQLPG